jgi:hypothetical protein
VVFGVGWLIEAMIKAEQETIVQHYYIMLDRLKQRGCRNVKSMFVLWYREP